jgi:hypothetical protein
LWLLADFFLLRNVGWIKEVEGKINILFHGEKRINKRQNAANQKKIIFNDTSRKTFSLKLFTAFTSSTKT